MASNDYSDGGGSPRDKEAPSGGEAKLRGRKRRKVSFLTLNKIYIVDYKDVPLLRRFINERGKMLSTRQTGATASQQRQIARAVRRARELALLPYVVGEFLGDRRDSGRGGRGRYSQEPRQSEQAAAAPEQQPTEVAPVEAPAVEAPTPEPAAQAEQTTVAEA